MKALFAKVTNVKAFPSTGQCRVEIEAPYEQFSAIVALLHDTEVLVTVAPQMSSPYGVVDGKLGAPTTERMAPHGEERQKKRPLGPLAQWAVLRCKDENFLEWLRGDLEVFGESDAREAILSICEISSRRELDSDERAAQAFDEFVRKPFNEWMKKAGRA